MLKNHLIGRQNFEQRLDDRVWIDSSGLGLADDFVRPHGHERLQRRRRHEEIDPQVAVPEDVFAEKERIRHWTRHPQSQTVPQTYESRLVGYLTLPPLSRTFF